MPINLVDLGVVYGIDERDGVVEVDLTFTAMGCPASDFILEDVRERLLREDGVREVRVKVVWDPPWTSARMTQAGRDALEAWGLPSAAAASPNTGGGSASVRGNGPPAHLPWKATSPRRRWASTPAATAACCTAASSRWAKILAAPSARPTPEAFAPSPISTSPGPNGASSSPPTLFSTPPSP